MNQRGFILPNLYLILGGVAILAMLIGYVQWQRVRMANLEASNAALAENVRIQSEMSARNAARNAEAAGSRIESALKAERNKQRVDAGQLERLSERKSGLITRMARDAVRQNVEVLNCKSDLRDTSKECGDVR